MLKIITKCSATRGIHPVQPGYARPKLKLKLLATNGSGFDANLCGDLI